MLPFVFLPLPFPLALPPLFVFMYTSIYTHLYVLLALTAAAAVCSSSGRGNKTGKESITAASRNEQSRRATQDCCPSSCTLSDVLGTLSLCVVVVCSVGCYALFVRLYDLLLSLEYLFVCFFSCAHLFFFSPPPHLTSLLPISFPFFPFVSRSR